jgi:4-hydroxybenzoate polyprenyltransferase
MFRALLKTMRPKQWLKNGLVFVPLFFDGKLLEVDNFVRALAAFGLFCAGASAVYLMNDLRDIEQDRQHPTKRRRPLASGQLSVPLATAAAVVLAAVSLPTAFLLAPAFGLILLGYLLVQMAYSLWLKHVVLLDVLIVAAGFILRVAAGAAIIVPAVERFSPWLYVCTFLLALFVALGKRRQEIVLLGGEAGNHRAILDDYSLDLLDRLIGIVTTSALVAYSLYTFLAEGLPANHFMMLTIPFVLYGIFRYLYLIHVRHEGGAPEEIFLRDRSLQIALLFWGLSVYMALYVLV